MQGKGIANEGAVSRNSLSVQRVFSTFACMTRGGRASKLRGEGQLGAAASCTPAQAADADPSAHFGLHEMAQATAARLASCAELLNSESRTRGRQGTAWRGRPG